MGINDRGPYETPDAYCERKYREECAENSCQEMHYSGDKNKMIKIIIKINLYKTTNDGNIFFIKLIEFLKRYLHRFNFSIEEEDGNIQYTYIPNK